MMESQLDMYEFENTTHWFDIHDQWYNSINLESILYFDLVRIKAFSFTIGAGGVINNSKGLNGETLAITKASNYFNDWHYGAYLGGGFRFTPANSRFAFELMPVNIHLGSDDFLEWYFGFGLEVKLN